MPRDRIDRWRPFHSPNVRQDVVGVLAEVGGVQPCDRAPAIALKRQRLAQHIKWTELRMIDRDVHPKRFHLLVLHRFADRIDRSARHARGVELLDQFHARDRPGLLGEYRAEFLSMGRARLDGAVIRIPEKMRSCNTSHSAANFGSSAAARLTSPSAVGKRPVGISVGWSLPACPGTSPVRSQRATWKSRTDTSDSRSDV